MQCIERMEELIQGGFLAAEELDIVNKQHINLSVSTVEFSNLTLALVRVLQRVNEFVREFLRRDVSNLQPGILDQCIVADGVQQVGFAQTRSAIDTQRVEILPGTFGHGQCDRTGKTVGIAGHEGIKREVLIEMSLGIAIHLLLTDRELRLGGGHRFPRCGCRLCTIGFFTEFGDSRRNFRRIWLRRLCLRKRFGLGFRHDLERGKHIFAGYRTQCLKQGIVQITLNGLKRVVVVHTQHDGRTEDAFRNNAFQPAFFSWAERSAVFEHRQRV